MYKKILLLAIIFFATSGIFLHAHAQMMTNYGNPSVTVNSTEVQSQQQEEAYGKNLFDQVQSQQTTCTKLSDSDFEKIGEYSMSQMLGSNTSSHVVMNQRIKQAHGETGEEQMHIQIGKSVTGCSVAASQNTRQNGGVSSMMGLNGFGMMDGNYGAGFSGFWIIAIVIHSIIVVDLILLGMWLWKQINKK